MMRRVALVAVLPLLLPLAPAQAAPTAEPRGGTLVIAVKGMPRGAAARVRLKGPKKFGRTLTIRSSSKTLRHLRSGVYRATASDLTSGGRTWSATVTPVKARVTRKRGKRILVRYRVDPVTPQPPTDPPSAPEQPTQPFPVVSAPAGITLVSTTAAGTTGNGQSRYSTWSPDGHALVFGSCAHDLGSTVAGCWLFQRDLAGATTGRLPGTRLGDDLEWGGEPDWAPDGSQLTFVSSFPLTASDTDQNSDVYVVPATGGTPQRLSQSAAGAGLAGGPYPPQARDPQWSPDSGSVSFRSGATSLVSGDGDEWVDIFVSNVTDRALTRLPQGVDVTDVRWAPDGNRLAFTAFRYSDDSTEVRNIHVVGTDGSGSIAVTTDGQSSQPSWSPDGSRIAFASPGSDVVPGDTNEASDVFVRDVASGSTTRISVAPDGGESLWSSTDPVWSPDGRRIAFVADSYESGIVVMVKDLVSGGLTQVTPGGSRDDCDDQDCVATYFESRDPVWSPDGTRLAFTSTHPTLVPGDSNDAADVFVATL